MGSCDSPVKITVGGKDWYYQKFYDDDGEVEAVNLYDAGGDFVREYSSLNRLTGSLGMMVRRQKEADVKRSKGFIEVEYPQKPDAVMGITDEEKIELRKAVVERLNELRGDMLVKDFATKVGLSVVNEYLSGNRVPTANALKRIADRCGVSVDWIIGRTDNRESEQNSLNSK